MEATPPASSDQPAIRKLYAKLGTHGRGEAVERARALGLLAPIGMGRASGDERTTARLT